MINKLDALTVDKIAAGEVVERPLSVVKELIENAIDAGGEEIIVEIRNGGKTYIRVTDNGKGINKNEITKALKRHYTSKINKIDDLDYLNTLGFRGEALASISSVSKVEITTKEKEDQSGINILYKNNEIISKKEVGCITGTTIIVRDLFYNLPVRKKFLGSDISEGNKITNLINKMALLNKNITFKFIRDRKIIFNTPKNTSLINKITSLYGEDFSSSLMKIENNSKEEYEIKGYISDLNYFRGNRNHQMVFVNDRYIKSSKIAEIVEENYKTVIPSGKFPGFILYIYTDPKNIDVNIHPQKYEIKFKDFDSLKKSLSNLLENNLNKNLFSKRYNVKDTKEEFLDSKSNTDFNINFINNKPKPTGVRDDESFYPKNTNGIEKIDVNLNIEEPDNQDVSKETSFYKQDKVENLDFFEDRREYKTKKNKINFNTLHYIGYIFDTYILFQDYKNRVLYIMDQHAAHERINYENYLEKYRNRKITKQEILIPIKINLSADEYETTVKNNNIFKEFGMEVEGFGVNTIIVRTIPSFLQHTDAKKLFYSILENLDRFDRGNIEIDNLIKQACTDSVKSGDILSKKEIDALIEDLLRCDKPYTCPHGRPILVELDEKDLKKLFNRIQS
ncbi:MAG TPA: DNA mismatch repair endonuclease MutL [Clostridiales bacterium]|jgi:DNA mismatch repair protein MutL|nr:DNA mismatch repair endonuclease MutL [Clostridiales bacterium]